MPCTSNSSEVPTCHVAHTSPARHPVSSAEGRVRSGPGTGDHDVQQTGEITDVLQEKQKQQALTQAPLPAEPYWRR